MQNIATTAGLAPQILEIIENDDEVAIIMEGLETTMDAELRAHPERKSELIAAGVDLIDKLYSSGIFHGDVHMGNIMKDRAGKWFFIDFGLSRPVKSRKDIEISKLQLSLDI
jgi:predicted unusual protein kinase regulating ubiquinone biosynthesis (AarF/ABC1/UbiB family)